MLGVYDSIYIYRFRSNKRKGKLLFVKFWVEIYVKFNNINLRYIILIMEEI